MSTSAHGWRSTVSDDIVSATRSTTAALLVAGCALCIYGASSGAHAGSGWRLWGEWAAFVTLVLVVIRGRERHREGLLDGLTRLPNRASFTQAVDRAAARGGPVAVLLMDLDRFKEVNDTLGHFDGDVLLTQVAGRLRGALRKGDMAARLGGDEFAVLLGPVTGAGEAQALAARALESLHRPFVIRDLALHVGASVGIALSPDHGSGAATLLQKAEVAMYKAKASRSGARLYQPEHDTSSPRRLALQGALRQAIEEKDILVYFQPKARLSDGFTLGVEALVRWDHPALGLLPPDEFIPAAEQSGLIAPLTTYVLRAALRQCLAWRQAGHELGVAVNLSVHSLLDSKLPEHVASLLSEAGVPARCLTLEITESSVMADPARTIAVLERLAALGARLSVDDFGTGYSSLAYLQRLPVDEVKVDKSFVFGMSSRPGDATIVQSIIELGHNLGLSVVAEGVEDKETWERLRAGACDVAQGYLLSKPVPATEISKWLSRHNPRRFNLTDSAPVLGPAVTLLAG